MIITKKAMPRRTFLRGMGATLALPLLEAMVPAATPLVKTPANPVRRLGFVFMPMGCDRTRWTPPGDPKFARAGERTRHGDQQPGVAERLSRHPCDVQCRLPQRGAGEVDGKRRLL